LKIHRIYQNPPYIVDFLHSQSLWDAGTEVDQEPGLGADQVQRQAGPNTGAADPDNTVRLASDDFQNLPDPSDVLQVTVTPTSETGFVVRIENVSTETTLTTSDGNTQAVPLSPGVWVVHAIESPLYAAGVEDPGFGLEAVAEDGNPSEYAAALATQAGLNVVLSPGVWVVHKEHAPIFSSGDPDLGEGLEALAEDGAPLDLLTTLSPRSSIPSAGIFNTPVGDDEPGALITSRAYEFFFTASPGDRLSFATMFVLSNDLFYAFRPEGIPLWDENGNPISADVTDLVVLWDAGTEENQEPGLGADQAPRQAAPNTGAADPDNTVRLAEDPSGRLPETASAIRVTISVKQP